MENQEMCEKTLSRLESVRKNTVDDYSVVDALIGSGIRRSIVNKGKRYSFQIQFLYASDLDGWYDDKSRTMYLALDHAIFHPVNDCLEREIKKYKLNVENVSDAKQDLIKVFRFFVLIMFFIFTAAFVVYWLSTSESMDTALYVGFGLWCVIAFLFIMEFFWYEPDLLHTELKKEEDSFDPVLGTINNCGGIMVLDRIDLKTGWGIYRNYVAFMGLPIIFHGSFLAKEVETGTWRRKSYKVLGQIKTSAREIYHLYILSYGGIATVALVVFFIYRLGAWFNFWN